jgi:hypothetical protein
MTRSIRLTGDRLRRRIDRMGVTYVEAAKALGLTYDGLQKQMRGTNPVSRQTALLLEYLERWGRVRLTELLPRRRE